MRIGPPTTSSSTEGPTDGRILPSIGPTVGLSSFVFILWLKADRTLGGVVRTAGTRFVHLVLATLGRLIGVLLRPLFLAHSVDRRGIRRVPRLLDAGSLYVLGLTFSGFLRVYRSSLFAHRTLLGQRPSFDAFSFFSVSVPGPGSTVTIHLSFRMKMVRKV
jgi:hypothetical protein